MTSGTSQPVIWSPLPGSQVAALSCPCNHILYEGTRGPGKTDAQLMAFRKLVGRGYGQHWRGVIFDREYKNLDDLVTKSQRWFPQFRDGAKFKQSKGDYKWSWPSGEELLFRVLKSDQDYWNYHGHEYPFIGWNELTKFPSEALYDSMMSCNRSSYAGELPEIPLVVFSTSNPYGPGHNWVKKRFVDVAEPGKIIKITKDVYNPRTKKRETITKTQTRIFGSYKENKYLSPEYILELESITDENKRKAWLWGDWDIVAGGAFDDLWDHAVHVVQRFKVPKSWRVDRSFDWGSTHPFSVGWWAEANGEEAQLLDGSTFCPPAGTLIRIAEWYGADQNKTNTGLKFSATEIGWGIIDREKTLLSEGWIQTTVSPGPADNQIGDVRESDVETIAKKMRNVGIEWERSDKSAGSRVNGLQLIRDRLKASLDKIGPGLYFMDNCTAATSQLPVLPRSTKNPDDIDTTAEDHCYDDIRYRCLAGFDRPANIHIKFPY